MTILENQKGLFHNLMTHFPDAGESDKRFLVHVGKLHIPPSR